MTNAEHSSAPGKLVQPSNRLRSFLERNCDALLISFGKCVNKIDVVCLTRTVIMQDKLEQIFPAKTPNLGMKHREIDRNLWTNDYLINVKNSLKYQDIDFDVDFDQ